MKIDNRWLFVLVFFTIGIPVLWPIGLPVQVTPETTGMYNAIESLKPDSLVYVGIDFLSWSEPEMMPMSLAVFRHIIQKPVKVVMACFGSVDGPMFTEAVMKQIGIGSKKYGQDIVFLGYIPGGETAVAAFARDVKSLISVDAYKSPVSTLPIMDRVKSATDFSLFIILGPTLSGDPFVKQVQAPYKAKMAWGTDSPTYPSEKPYYQSGQLVGLLNGMRGAAEYELVTGAKGRAIAGMDIQSITQMLMILAIIVGNILYFATRKKK